MQTTRIIATSNIGKNKTVTITRLADIIDIKDGDEALYLLDKNGNFGIRNFNKDLKKDEKYISANVVKESRYGIVTRIPREIIEVLDLQVGDDLIFILDGNDIIIKGPILPDTCIIKGIIIGMTALCYNHISTIPENVRDLMFVDTGDVVAFVQKNRNIVVQAETEVQNKLNIIGMSKLGIKQQIYLKKELVNILDPTDSQMLWIIDENGDIIMRSTTLPRCCI